MPQIKRYPNRKLYDTEAKRYVTLDELAGLIQAGADIQVIDHESGEDLTNVTLTQVVLEQQKKSSGFSVALAVDEFDPHRWRHAGRNDWAGAQSGARGSSRGCLGLDGVEPSRRGNRDRRADRQVG